MRIHFLQHATFEGPAYLETLARANGAALTGSHVYAGEKLPDAAGIDLLAVLGGPMGVHDEAEHPWLTGEKRFIGKVIDSGAAVVGVCLGAQLIAEVMGARVYRNPHREIGWFPVTSETGARTSRVGRSFPDEFMAFHWHGDTFELPAGAVHLVRSAACANQAFIAEDRILGLQFHLEVTPASIRILHENCRSDIDGSRFVQGVEEILNTAHIDGCNRLFEKIFARLIRP